MIEDGIKFYYCAAKLKDMLRQGAVQWKVDKPRLESIAEHIYGAIILAISLKDELNVEVNLDRVVKMLAVHELEELFIGDLTPLDNVDKNSLKADVRKKIAGILHKIVAKDEILSLVDEFNLVATLEAKFAKAMDKLECVLEFKKYVDLGQVDLTHLTQDMLKNKTLKWFVDQGKYDLADIFFIYHMPAYEYLGIDENFWFSTLKNLKID